MSELELNNIVDNLVILDKDTRAKALQQMFYSYSYADYKQIRTKLAAKLRT